MTASTNPRYYSVGKNKVFVDYVVKRTVVRRFRNNNARTTVKYNRRPVANTAKSNGFRRRASLNVTKPIQKKPKENQRPNNHRQLNRKSEIKPTFEDLDRDLECYMRKEATSVEKLIPQKQPSGKKPLNSRRQKNQKPAVTPSVEDLDRELEAYMKKPVVV